MQTVNKDLWRATALIARSVKDKDPVAEAQGRADLATEKVILILQKAEDEGHVLSEENIKKIKWTIKRMGK